MTKYEAMNQLEAAKNSRGNNCVIAAFGGAVAGAMFSNSCLVPLLTGILAASLTWCSGSAEVARLTNIVYPKGDGP